MNNKTVRFGSVCSGVECASLASASLGWTPAWFSEIDDFPSAVLAHHFPDVPNLGDMTTIAERIRSGEVEAPELLVGGTPCFTAGHLVLTKDGYKPIEDIKVGDWVMTHKGRLRRVLRIGSKLAEVGELSIRGRDSFLCTPNHPFLTVTVKHNYYKRQLEILDERWEEAQNLTDLSRCVSIRQFDGGKCLNFPTSISEKDALFIAGLYLGDGYIKKYKNKRKKALLLTINKKKLEQIRQRLGLSIKTTSITFPKNSLVACNLWIYNTELAEWLEKEFNTGSENKTIKSWVLSHAFRDELLQGYLLTDGSRSKTGFTISTISKSLAFGISSLIDSLGYVSNIHCKKNVTTKTDILGKICNIKQPYIIKLSKTGSTLCNKSFITHLAKPFLNHHIKRMVYNIEVLDDNSYIVEGIVVHNCQAFSLSGKRESLGDDRGQLTLEFVKLLDTIDEQRAKLGQLPAVCFWENVQGVLSAKDGAFGYFLSGLMGFDFPIKPPDGRKFPDCGAIISTKRSCAWRLLNSEYFGSAQSRPRIYVVASAREGFDPRKVLFELSGVRGNHKPSRKKGKTAPATPTAGAGSNDRGTEGTTGTEEAIHDEIARKHLVVLNDQGGSVMSVSGDGTIGTLRAETHAHEPIVTETIPLVDEKIGTLTACDLVKMPSNQSVANGLMFPELTVFENHRQDARYRELSDKMMTLTAHMGTGGGNVPFVVEKNIRHFEKNIRLFNMQPIESNMHNAGREIEKTPTLTATDPNPNKNQGGVCIVELEGKPYRLRVRKLLPIECERLMGMPDNWTLIPYKGKDVESCPDSPRYKACGNGWSVETITWIFNRLDRELHGEKQVEETQQ